MSTEEIQAAAVSEVYEHGLHGRADSPPEWEAAMKGATAGDPILVKDPEDSRDDFFLVPLNPASKLSARGVWVMLDPETLKLREASLLNDWMVPAFPDGNDVQQVSQQSVTLPDGTVVQFSPDQLKANVKNLVWKASAATILPYWPVKEFTAAHPVTGVQTPIYVTQEGNIYTSLDADEPGDTPKESSPQPEARKEALQPKSKSSGGIFTKILAAATIPLAAAVTFLVLKSDPKPEVFDPTPLTEEIASLKDRVRDRETTIRNLDDQVRKISYERDDWKKRSEKIVRDNDGLKRLAEDLKKAQAEIKTLTDDRDTWRKKYTDIVKSGGDEAKQLKEIIKKKDIAYQTLEKDRGRWKKKYEDLLKKGNPKDEGPVNDDVPYLLKLQADLLAKIAKNPRDPKLVEWMAQLERARERLRNLQKPKR